MRVGSGTLWPGRQTAPPAPPVSPREKVLQPTNGWFPPIEKKSPKLATRSHRYNVRKTEGEKKNAATEFPP